MCSEQNVAVAKLFWVRVRESGWALSLSLSHTIDIKHPWTRTILDSCLK